MSVSRVAAKPHVIEVHGHRGARARLPENTLPAFEHALESGADVLELDLHVSKDNRLVVTHDPQVSGELCLAPDGKPVAGKPLVYGLTLAELKQFDCGSRRPARFPQQRSVPGTRMPTLEEVFELVRRSKHPNAAGIRFNIELKSEPEHPEYTPPPAELARLLVAALAREKLLGRSIIQSFDFRTLDEVRKLEPGAVIALLFEEGSAEGMAAAAAAHRAQIVAPRHQLVDMKLVERLRVLGVKLVPWTVNAPQDWDRLLALGVDGIITDDPAALISHLGKSRRPE